MKEFPFSIVCAGLLVVLGFIGMKLGRVDGIIFLVIFVAYLFWMIYSAKRQEAKVTSLKLKKRKWQKR